MHFISKSREMPVGRNRIYLLTGLLPLLVLFSLILMSCGTQRHIGRNEIVSEFLDNPAISDTYTGVAIYDADAREYLFTHNADKLFVPASNVKLATLYGGLKYLGDFVPGLEYMELNDTMFVRPTGDPTFLLKDYPDQVVYEFLQNTNSPLVFIEPEWKTEGLGYGWPWTFYLDYYMPERSPFPIYGNGIQWAQRDMPGLNDDVRISYVMSDPGHPWPIEIRDSINLKLEVKRPFTKNEYIIYPGLNGNSDLFVPFAANGMKASLELLGDTLNKEVGIISDRPGLVTRFATLYSGLADSLFCPMMLYSDNFFAEQTLIMISHELFGKMDEELIIDFLLKNDLSEFPRKPRWVDGSGLSRYNLFSPRSFIWLLEKLKDEFGFERIKGLLPSGGEGTLEDYYIGEQGKIYAKTGSLDGNVVALSGFLVTDRDKMLIFSVIVNNHNKPSVEVRKAVEDFLQNIISN